MSLRDLAAQHRRAILDRSGGLGEAIVHIDGTTGVRTEGRGQWMESPSDNRSPQDLGAEAGLGRSQVAISADFIPALTRADSIERSATGEVWQIEHIIPTPGVGRKLILSQAGEALARGVR